MMAPPVDNIHLEGQIRPIAVGKHNWFFAGNLSAGKLAAAVITLVNLAQLNEHDPCTCIRDALERYLVYASPDTENPESGEVVFQQPECQYAAAI